MHFCPIGSVSFMCMKRFFMFIVLPLILSGGMLSAQTVSNVEKRKMNLILLETIKKLEAVSDMSSLSEANEFVSMFRDHDEVVYNDLIGVSDEEYLPLMEYVSTLRKMRDVEVSFRNVSKSDMFVYKGSLCVKVTLDKIISYRDERNVLYSSEDFFGAPHKVAVIFSYDDFDGTCLIEAVEGTVENSHLSRKDHVVYTAGRGLEGLRFRLPGVQEKDGYYEYEECGYLPFNREGQAILPGSAVNEDWYYMQNIPGEWDPDVFINPRMDRNGIMKLDLSRKWFRAKVYNSIAPAGAFIIEGDLDGKYSFANETGVEGRFMMNAGRRLNLGIYGAVGISYNFVGMNVKDFSYSYQVAGQTRKYEFDFLGQSSHFVDAVLSGGIAMEHSLSQRLSLDFAVGGKAYYNIMAAYGNMRCDYKVTQGTDEPIHKKGHFKKETIKNQMEIQPDVWPCPLSAEVSLGINYSLSKSIQLSCGLEYEYGLNWYYQSENLSYKDYETPVTYSMKNSADVVKWSMGNSYSLKKCGLWLDFGVVFKF